MRVKKYKHDEKIMNDVKNVYEKAFPPDEKAPFSLIMRKIEQKKAEMLVAYEDDEFIGFAYNVCIGDVVYLFYLAVSEEKRGCGYGRKIVKAVKMRYKGKKIFLGREQLDKSAENYEQRVNRRNFYLKCGFKDVSCCIKEAGVVYDVMSIGGEKVSPEEYDRLIISWCGIMRKLVFNMKLIEK